MLNVTLLSAIFEVVILASTILALETELLVNFDVVIESSAILSLVMLPLITLTVEIDSLANFAVVIYPSSIFSVFIKPQAGSVVPRDVNKT